MTRPMHLEWPLYRWMRWVLELGGGFTLFAAFFYVITRQEFELFVRVAVPVLATYIATAALFYNRARALPRGVSKVRSLYAAERSTQATLFTVIGLAIACVIFGWSQWLGIAPLKDVGTEGPWLWVYLPAYAFLMTGYTSFMLGVRVIAKEFLHPLSPREIAKRVKNAP